MAALTERGIPLSSLCPNYLHSNSTSHTWPFSAIAELIDNAYDPDVSAKQFWIDKTVVKGHDCLAFMDNGAGMDYDKMYKMLSFGFSEKQAVNGHEPVGIYGNGFKSGSMRLGKDVIVFSKKADTMCVGLLSLTYLEQIKAKHVMVPIAMFNCTGQTSCVIPHHEESLRDILSYSLFQSVEEILSEINAIKGSMNSTGTRIIIWNLRKSSSGQSEFDFSTDRYDIRIPADVYEGTKKQFKRPEHEMQSGPESDYSLRAYCSILYLKPKMQIIIRGQKVKTELISKSLAHIVKDKYRPKIPNLKKPAPITFGFNTKSKEQYGIMMYHKNRLIKAYERVGCQLKANSKGVGVIGVIECNFLKPTHNKQDFDYTEEYRKTMQSLNVKLEEYWKEVHHRFQKKSNIPIENLPKFPDQNWVQCDDCLKWRKLPDGIDTAQLPEKWFCCMNPDTQYRSCSVSEEAEDSEDEPAYHKTYKQHEKNMKKQAQKTASPRPKAKTTPNSTCNLIPVRPGVSRSSDNMPVISNVVSLSTTPTRKRSMGLDIKNGMGKSARLLSNFSSSKPVSPSTSAASSEACASPSMFIPGDDSDEETQKQPNDNDIVIVESNQATFDLSDVKSEKYSDDAYMDASVAMQTTLLHLGNYVCSTTQTEPMQAMKHEVEDSEGKKSKEGERGTCQSEMEQDLLPLERSTNQEQEMNNEGQSTSETTNLNISTVKLELQEDEPSNGEVFAKKRPGTACEGETSQLQDPTLDLPDGEYMMTLVQQQQQQDNLMELLEAATRERDTCQTQMHLLTSRVEELEKSLQEQTEKAVTEKSKPSAAEQEYKVLYLQAQREKEQLQHELDDLREKAQSRVERKGEGQKSSAGESAETEEATMAADGEDELACHVDFLMRELDQRNKHQEELVNRVKHLEDENCSLLTCCESLQKDIQEMKTSSEMVKLNVEDGGTWTEFPHLPGSVSQDERLGEPESETGNATTQTCKLRLRELRRGIARLLVNYVPTLDLQQVNYDCDVIDEILSQVLDHVSSPLGAEQSS